jgi:hypothetical protein
MAITTDADPLSQSGPLQQVPPSPVHEEEAQHFAGADDVIIPGPGALEARLDDFEVSLDVLVEENAPPEQHAPEEEVDEETEVQNVVPSPLRNEPIMPSKPIMEEK